jgi:putative membrane protein
LADFQVVEVTNNASLFQENLMGFEMIKPGAVLASLLFALVGVAVFWLCFVIIDKITPYDLWSEIVEKQNVALALVVAAMSLGICIIVAAAIH